MCLTTDTNLLDVGFLIEPYSRSVDVQRIERLFDLQIPDTGLDFRAFLGYYLL